MRKSRSLTLLSLLAFCALLTSCNQTTSPVERSLNESPVESWKGAKEATNVLVVGGTPSGVAAALAAARNGAKVLLIEPHDELGGDIVSAMLNMFDVPMAPGGSTSAANGIFGEFYQPLGVAFDIHRARQLFQEKVQAQPNITVWKRMRVSEVLKRDAQVVGAIVEKTNERPHPVVQEGKTLVTADVVIDATNDADFAARAGAGFYLGREAGGSDTKQQSVSLLFSVAGANWQAMTNYVNSAKPMEVSRRIGQEYASDVAPTTSKEVAQTTLEQTPRKQVMHRLGGVDGNYIWERGDVVKNYQPRSPDVIAMSINFGRQKDGTVVLNTLNAVGVDGLDLASKERARKAMIAELPSYIAYLRKAMPGLENIQLAKVAPELYIRETRHLVGLAQLTVGDVQQGTKFPDRIALASYPLDLHPYEKGQGNPFGPKRYAYSIPLRSVVPQNLKNVLVASRSLSASYEAAGSARVIPITTAVGQACGVTAAIATKQKVSPQHIAQTPALYEEVQNILRDDSANIGDGL